MSDFDVFNGDADGLCALHQLRLAEPRDSTLVTGVKRDIQLLERIEAKGGDRVAVLDISLDKNRDALERILAAGAEVFYCDHHFAGDIPQSHQLDALIDTTADVCTSLLVNQRLEGRFLAWAVTAAYGDNLYAAAVRSAEPLHLDDARLDQLKELGTYLNYNGYGSSLEDLYFPPQELYARIRPYPDPFQFIAEDSAFRTLRDGYREDMTQATATQPEQEGDHHALFVLPDASWARRVSGVFANELARNHRRRAHALLTRRKDEGFVVSVRAPLDNKNGADALCRQFPSGGGRQAAAGINHLPESEFDRFASAFAEAFK